MQYRWNGMIGGGALSRSFRCSKERAVRYSHRPRERSLPRAPPRLSTPFWKVRATSSFSTISQLEPRHGRDGSAAPHSRNPTAPWLTTKVARSDPSRFSSESDIEASWQWLQDLWPQADEPKWDPGKLRRIIAALAEALPFLAAIKQALRRQPSASQARKCRENRNDIAAALRCSPTST